MDHEEEIALECEGDALAEATQLDHSFPFQLARGGVDGAEDERAGEPDFVQSAANQPRLQRLEIDGHVGKFRHDADIIEPVRTFGILVAGWLLGGAMIVSLGGHRSAEGSAAERWVGVIREVSGPGRPAAGGAAGRPPALQRAATARATAILIPVVGITSADLRDTFAEVRGGGRTHRAMDILAPRGTPVVAAVDGTIRKLFTSKAGGLTIYQFDRAEERVYYYAHLDSYASGLAEGAFVAQGSVIGYVGITGNAPADTPHLHFSIETLPPTKEWWKGEPVNPYPLLTR